MMTLFRLLLRSIPNARDARKAIDLLRWAGELAERRGADTVIETDVRDAQEKYTENRKLRHISGISTQKKLSIYAVAATANYAREHPEWIPADLRSRRTNSLLIRWTRTSTVVRPS